MDQKQFDAVLSDAEKRLRRLKVLYEQWFVGIERMEPAIPRKELEDMITRLRKEPLSNTAQRFRLQQLVQRHVAFSTHWRRIGRQIEEGTYERDLRKAKRRQQKDSPREANGADMELSMDVDIDVDVDLTDVLAEADRAAEIALERNDALQPLAAEGQPRNGRVAARSFELEAAPAPQPVAAGAFGSGTENPATGVPALGKPKPLPPGMPVPPKLGEPGARATGAFAVPAAVGARATGAFAVPAMAGRAGPKTGEHAAPAAQGTGEHAAVGQHPTGEHAAPAGAQRATGANAAPGVARATGANATPGAALPTTGAHAAPAAAAHATGEHAAPASAQRPTGAHAVPAPAQRATGAFAAPVMPRKTGEHVAPGASPTGEAQPRAARPLVPPPAAAAKQPAAPAPAAAKPPTPDAASALRAARTALRGTPPDGTAAATGGEARRPSTEPRAISPFALPSAGSVRPQPLTQPKAPPPPPVVPKPAPVQARNPDVQARPAATRPANNNAPGASSSVDVERIYSQYVAARERNQERTDNVKRDALEKTIRGMLPNLEKKHAGKKIDFEVVVKDGKVALKPIAK